MPLYMATRVQHCRVIYYHNTRTAGWLRVACLICHCGDAAWHNDALISRGAFISIPHQANGIIAQTLPLMAVCLPDGHLILIGHFCRQRLLLNRQTECVARPRDFSPIPFLLLSVFATLPNPSFLPRGIRSSVLSVHIALLMFTPH